MTLLFLEKKTYLSKLDYLLVISNDSKQLYRHTLTLAIAVVVYILALPCLG